MSQHDMDIANQAFAATRADINSALLALVSNNSGATAPATTFAYQWWADTTAGILKQRNAANSAWVSILNLATGVPLGAAASGANADITSLTALTAGGLPNNSVLTADIADANVTPAKLSQPLTLGAAVQYSSFTTTTYHDFTGIPSWAKRVTIFANGVSTTGASQYLLQIGSGSILNTGYDSSAWQNNTTITSNTTGFLVTANVVAGNLNNGKTTIELMDASAFKYMCSGVGGAVTSGPQVQVHAGSKTVGAAIDRIRFTTVAGTDTFDAGSINIMYE